VFWNAGRNGFMFHSSLFTLEGNESGYSEYLYHSMLLPGCLLQYKECGDEALKDVFLYAVKRKKLKRRYRGSDAVSDAQFTQRRWLKGPRLLPSAGGCLLSYRTGDPGAVPEERSSRSSEGTGATPARQQMREAICP
jgi:hypothetical protein